MYNLHLNSKKGLFRIIIFSSNDPYFLEERPGYYICLSENGSKLLQAVPKSMTKEICGSESEIFIPKSKIDFVRVMDSLDTTNLSMPFRQEIEL